MPEVYGPTFTSDETPVLTFTSDEVPGRPSRQILSASTLTPEVSGPTFTSEVSTLSFMSEVPHSVVCKSPIGTNAGKSCGVLSSPETLRSPRSVGGLAYSDPEAVEGLADSDPEAVEGLAGSGPGAVEGLAYSGPGAVEGLTYSDPEAVEGLADSGARGIASTAYSFHRPAGFPFSNSSFPGKPKFIEICVTNDNR